MSNAELITCDYAGCRKPFAYREKGFNLCAEHCSAFDYVFRAAEKIFLSRKAAAASTVSEPESGRVENEQ